MQELQFEDKCPSTYSERGDGFEYTTFLLKYYAWFHASNLKFQGNKCTGGRYLDQLQLTLEYHCTKNTGYFNIIRIRLTYDKSQVI
jgi:hypothetical protein